MPKPPGPVTPRLLKSDGGAPAPSPRTPPSAPAAVLGRVLPADPPEGAGTTVPGTRDRQEHRPGSGATEGLQQAVPHLRGDVGCLHRALRLPPPPQHAALPCRSHPSRLQTDWLGEGSGRRICREFGSFNLGCELVGLWIAAHLLQIQPSVVTENIPATGSSLQSSTWRVVARQLLSRGLATRACVCCVYPSMYVGMCALCACVCACLCTHAFVCLHTCVSTCVHVPVHTYVLCAAAHVCVCTDTFRKYQV